MFWLLCALYIHKKKRNQLIPPGTTRVTQGRERSEGGRPACPAALSCTLNLRKLTWISRKNQEKHHEKLFVVLNVAVDQSLIYVSEALGLHHSICLPPILVWLGIIHTSNYSGCLRRRFACPTYVHVGEVLLPLDQLKNRDLTPAW